MSALNRVKIKGAEAGDGAHPASSIEPAGRREIKKYVRIDTIRPGG